MPVVKRISTYDPLTFFMLHPRNSQVKLRIEELQKRFESLKVPYGKRRLYYYQCRERFTKARKDAVYTLREVRQNARNILFKKQNQARATSIKYDVKRLTDALNDVTKDISKAVSKQIDRDWEMAEKKHKKTRQALQDMAVLSLDVVHSAAKYPAELLGFFTATEQYVEDMGYNNQTCSLLDILTGKNRVSLRDILQEQDPEILSKLEVKLQHLFEQLENVKGDLKEPFSKLREAVEPALNILNGAIKEHSLLAIPPAALCLPSKRRVSLPAGPRCSFSNRRGSTPDRARRSSRKRSRTGSKTYELEMLELVNILTEMDDERGIMVDGDFSHEMLLLQEELKNHDLLSYAQEAEKAKQQRSEKLQSVRMSFRARFAHFYRLQQPTRKSLRKTSAQNRH